jgi:hypothetical protein
MKRERERKRKNLVVSNFFSSCWNCPWSSFESLKVGIMTLPQNERERETERERKEIYIYRKRDRWRESRKVETGRVMD